MKERKQGDQTGRQHGREKAGFASGAVAGRGKSSGGSGPDAHARNQGKSVGGSGHDVRARGAQGKSVGSASRQQGKGVQRRQATAIAGLPVQVGDAVNVDIIGFTHEGEGVGRVEGYTLFVRGALPGDRVRAEVASVGKSFGRARLAELLAGSPDRIAAPCAIYEQCGGCQLQHWDYAAQLRWKRQLVADNLARIGKMPVVLGDGGDAGDSADANGSPSESRPPVIVHPTIGMDEPWRYRNKAQVPIGSTIEGGLIGGFFEQGSHDIVDMDVCLITQEPNEETVRVVKRIARLLGWSSYDRDTGRGLLRHVVVRHAEATGERMIVLVTNGRDLPHEDELVALIREAVPAVASICQNVNTSRTPVVFGDETRVLLGRDVIYDEIGDIRFAISARSFFQVNPVQTERLYGAVLKYAALTGEETVIDAYCGIGTITLFLARHARRVYGVEIVPEAIEDARRNAALNGIANADFAVGAAEDVLPRWQAEGVSPDVIVVDPPRKGCDPRLLETMLQLRPQRIVYVSCNPSTLARDLRVLEDGGYRTVEAQPVDMFPHTGHVECSVWLEWSGAK